MSKLENQLKIQKDKIIEISSLANKKEEKLNNNINQYLKQIDDLKNELELLNTTITNLTEEKENNTIKLTELIHENEQLKKNNSSIIKSNSIYNKNSNNNNELQNKKYEDLIIKLKKNIMILNEEKKALEEVVIKQEEKINELTLKADNASKEIIEKNKEIKESMEYNEKLANTIDFHKKEIQKLKQSISNSNNKTNNFNNKSKDMMSIMNLQKEIQSIKKEIEAKDSKISIITMNNKILQNKVNKLSQTANSGFINDPKNNTNNKINDIINKDLKSSSILASKNIDRIMNKDKNKVFIVAKPKLALQPLGIVNGRQNSTSIRSKYDLFKNEENNFNNNESNIRKKNSNILLKIPQKRNNSNSNNIQRKNNTNNKYLNKSNINEVNLMKICKNSNNSQLNKIIDKKYKEIESKYKKEINKEMKDDILFDDDDINNVKIKEEIAMDNNNFEPIDVVSNMVSQTLKPKKNMKNNEESLNMSQEKDFQIIESYCLLSGERDTNNNDENNSKDNAVKEDESKIENNRVEDLHNDVKKIFGEF